jgi:hypothetical protein
MIRQQDAAEALSAQLMQGALDRSAGALIAR